MHLYVAAQTDPRTRTITKVMVDFDEERLNAVVRPLTQTENHDNAMKEGADSMTYTESDKQSTCVDTQSEWDVSDLLSALLFKTEIDELTLLLRRQQTEI
ncbi:hypothetical protein [Pseudotabrizicola sp.]|uniref:hypothetical protein n=1 Tax=Pseudotabrizicola sp. TaxID=2939647 RepID=UPI002715A9D6|nr:hypothetical protein [Pseudotabrizicola sp.]MDO8882368.1 hypothetical protein [Pseudotabrizicola sp.]MDP2079525.1 hypothetical protein [Pseudotabrizicola sp.]